MTRENERGIKKEIQIPWLASKVSGLAFYYHFGGGGKVYPDFRTVARRSRRVARPIPIVPIAFNRDFGNRYHDFK